MVCLPPQDVSKPEGIKGILFGKHKVMMQVAKSGPGPDARFESGLAGMGASSGVELKPELLLEGIEAWLQEPLVSRQISPTLVEIIKTTLNETYMGLALLPTPARPSSAKVSAAVVNEAERG
jgi:hypothetical protein